MAPMLRSARNPGATFLIILAAYFALHVVVRLVLPTTLEHDEAQPMFLSQYMAIGYAEQPPFYNWLQNVIIYVFGVSRASLAVLKNVMLYSTYLVFFLTARELLRDRMLAIVATLGLLTLPQLAFESQRDLTHTVAVFFAAGLFFFALVRTIKRPTLFAYGLTGIAIGIGVISKYNFLLLPLAACISLLMDRSLRRHVLDIRIVATGLIAALIVLPHGLWFIQNVEAATNVTLDKMTSDASYIAGAAHGIGSFVVAIIGFCALTVICFAATFRKNPKAVITAENDWIRFFERMFVIIAIALVLIILIGGVDSVRDRWLAPYLVAFPLYLCLKIEAAGGDFIKGCQRFIRLAGIFMVLIPAVLLLRVMTAGLTGEYQYINAPFDALVRDIEANAPKPSIFITQETHMAGNLLLQRPDVPAVALPYPAFRPEFQWSRETPAVIVWRERKGGTPPPMPAALRAWLDANGGMPDRIDVHTVRLPYHYGAKGDEYQFAYAIAYPR
jgi:lipopolysaccharide core galacturonosyltransferase RgtB